MSDKGEFQHAFDFFGDFQDLDKLEAYVEHLNRPDVTFWWEENKFMQSCEPVTCRCQQSCYCYRDLKDWERLTIHNGLTIDPQQPLNYSHGFHIVVYDPSKGQLLCMLSSTWEMTPRSKRAPTKDEMIDMLQWNISKKTVEMNYAIHQAQMAARFTEAMSRQWPPLAPRIQQPKPIHMAPQLI
jgi:hypothetical protein